MSTYIIGHIKPDLDSAVAPISLKYLFDRVDLFEKKGTKPVLAGKVNNETKFVFNKFDVPLPEILKTEQIKPTDKFVLVDHNEESQRLEGITNEQITDIFDHHKMAVDFSMPIFITTKPWGSTNTIIYWLMEKYNLKPDKNLASLMTTAILSDTVGLKGPTTTEADKLYLEELNKIAQIPNLDNLTLEIFKAKSNIDGLTPQQIVTNDYKIYDLSAKKVLIGQVETVEQQKVLAKKQDLLEAMKKVKADQKVNHIFVIISDVLKINSNLIYSNDEEKQIAEKAFGGRGETNTLDIGSRLSRKKEIVPAIEKALKN